MTRPLNLFLWTFCLLMFGWGSQALAAGDSPWNSYPGGDVNCDMMVNVQDVVATVNAVLDPEMTLTPCGVDTCPEGEAMVGGNCHSIIDLCGSDNTTPCEGEGVEAVDVCCVEGMCIPGVFLPFGGSTPPICFPTLCDVLGSELCASADYYEAQCRPTESHDASTFEAGYNSCVDAMGSDDTPMSPGFTLVQSFADSTGSCETAFHTVLNV